MVKKISYTLFVFVLPLFLNQLSFASTPDNIPDQSKHAILTQSCTTQLGITSEEDAQSSIAISLPQQAFVHEEVLMELVFAENILPHAAIPSIKIELIQAPDNSNMNVFSGVPITTLSFDTVGTYSFKARIGYLIKSS